MSDYQHRNRFVSEQAALSTRARIQRRGGLTNFADQQYDLEWANQHIEGSARNSYFDYFFGGSDVRIYVAELGDDEEFGNIPIHNFAFNVNQNKTPVYGYWSYTFDAMMRGVRIISGQFTLVTRYPDYMKRMLAKAAKARVANQRNLADDYPAPIQWREDEENYDRYWGKNLDASALAQQGNEWSIHPPFSFVIVYGIQDTSIETMDLPSRFASYDSDNTLMKDQNQRLVEGFDPNQTTRIILDGCELTDVSRSYAPDVPFLAETYTFMARDIFTPQPGVRGPRVVRHHDSGIEQALRNRR